MSFTVDGRLDAFLRFGDDFLRRLDPEGVFGGGRVEGCTWSLDVPRRWTVRLTFSSGEVLDAAGTASDGGALYVSSLYFAYGGGRLKVAVNDATTLVSSFGSLSGLPAPLKAVMRVPGGDVPVAGPDPEALFGSAMDALLSRVEGADRYRYRFTTVSLLFRHAGDGAGVVISAMAPVSGGNVTVSADADGAGLAGKEVKLRCSLGGGRSFSARCVVSSEGHTLPSLVAAFALAGSLSGSSPKQRRRRASLVRYRGK